ncbi:MAG TPA: PASTA domain-containing protein, partial [Cyclobacteriaceae bacterium]|nr:PASTA domain-containing protein [Cyclobacteriaceae bacterium]
MKLKLPKINSVSGFLISLSSVIGILLISALVYFYIYLPGITNHGETLTVPNLEGMHMDDLEDFLVKRQLRYEVSDSSYTDNYPALTILSQYPKSGAKVKKNRKVYLTVNRVAPPSVPAPELVDRSLINAEAVLRSNELKRGKIIFRNHPFFNLVIEMRYNGEKIEAGHRIPKGSVIDLVVGDGGKKDFPTPNLIDLPLDEARFAIMGSNLNIGRIYLLADTLTARLVLVYKQKPEARENIKVGDAV